MRGQTFLKIIASYIELILRTFKNGFMLSLHKNIYYCRAEFNLVQTTTLESFTMYI